MRLHLGVLYLAGSLRKAGHNVQVWDCHQVTSWDAKKKKLVIHHDKLEYCDVLGLSATTANVCYGQELAKAWPAEIAVLGGPHASYIMHGPHERYRKQEYFEGFDFVMTGECEYEFANFCQRLDSGASMEEQAGLAWFGPEGELHRNPLPQNPVVTTLPIPAFDLWKGGFAKGALSASSARGKEFNASELMTASLYTARGCPYACTFCADARTPLREESLEQIREQVTLLKHLGVQAIRIQDDTLTIKSERAKAIADVLHEHGMKWRGTTRVNLVDEGLFSHFAKKGCTELGFGVEHGSDKMLKAMEKGTTAEKNTLGIKRCQDAGILARAFVMLGFPGETWETIEELKKWILQVKPDMVALSLFTPFPGSNVWNRPEHYGVRLPEGGFDKFWQFGMEDDPNSIFLDLPTISKPDLFKARQELIQLIRENIGEIDRTRLHGNIGVFGPVQECTQ